MAFKTKSYKKGDGWGYKVDRKHEADRSERHTIKRKLHADKTIHNKRLLKLSVDEKSSR